MIKTIIFDIGNVLAEFSWEKKYRSYDLTEEQYNRIVDKTVKSPIWNEYDRGVWTNQQVIEAFCDNDPIDADLIRNIHANMHGFVSKNDYAIEWIKYYQKLGMQVLYLSNFNEKIAFDCADALDFLPYVDGGIFSWKVKCIKPDEKIYKLLIEKYNLNPNECIFIDDNKNNLLTASKLGIHTVWCQNYSQAKNDIEEIIKRESKNG